MSTDIFESQRRRLHLLAYRILGSVAAAEDAVQDTYLKWQSADQAALRNPAAWLTTCCTRHCIDALGHAQRARTDYVGTWLPEPLQAATNDTPEAWAELASSLTTSFLLLLERLTPKERAAYLLYDIFDVPYTEVAHALSVSEPACRQLVSRARARVGKASQRPAPPPANQKELLAEFQRAVMTGDTLALSGLLSQDIELCADGGGKVPSLEEVLHGGAQVTAFLQKLRGYWKDYSWHLEALSGGLGVLLRSGSRVTAAVTFAHDEDGRVTNIYIVRNPDKLAHLAMPAEESQ